MPRFFCYLDFIKHIKWDVIISSCWYRCWKLKVWIWYRSQKRIESYYKHDGKQLVFYEKVHIKHREDVLVTFIFQEWKNSNLFDKNCTKKYVKYHIQHEEGWLRWIVIELANYYLPLIFPKRNCARTFSKPLRKN